MRKFLTRAIAAGMLMAFFPAYGETSNTVFYADFNNSENQQPMDTAADLNEATLAPPGVGVWSLTADHSAKASVFATGEASQGMVLYLQLHTKNSGQVVGTLNEPALFGGANSAEFDFDFKPNTSNAGGGYKHVITATDGKFNTVFTVEMSADPNDAYMVKVNGIPIGSAYRASNSALKLNSLSLTVTSAGISVTLTRGDTGGKTTVSGIAIGSSVATDISRFSIAASVAKNVNFDYDNFKIYQVIKTVPAPRLDLYMLTPP